MAVLFLKQGFIITGSWSNGMILALGARGREFDSHTALIINFVDVGKNKCEFFQKKGGKGNSIFFLFFKVCVFMAIHFLSEIKSTEEENKRGSSI